MSCSLPQNPPSSNTTGQQYNTGDVLVTLTQPIPLFNHFAIVFYKDGIGYVAHNSFMSGDVIITPLDEFMKRHIRKVYPAAAGLTDEGIYNKALECNANPNKKYNFFGYNCESFVREACGCNFGTDQRKSFAIVSFSVIAIVIIVWLIIRRYGKG